jgi:hypothetical protein
VTITNAAGAITIAATGGGGTGDVVGPASSTDNAFARFDSTTGKLLQNSTGATLSDTGAAVFTGALDVLGNSTAGSNIKLYEDTDNGSNYVAFKAPDTIASNVTWTLPAADGTSAQVLSTNGSGTLSWATASGSSQWTTSGSDIYYNTGNVGIGTTNFAAGKLSVLGRMGAFNTTGANDSLIQIWNNGTTSNIASSYSSTGAYTPLTFLTSDVERARIPAAGGFQAVGSISVGNATPTTSGAGITFPATQSDSSSANTLDDYEEGTWTPVITDGTNNATMAVGNGATYTKIGRSVTVNGACFTSSLGSVTSIVRISGLPFAAGSTNNFYGGGACVPEQINITAGQSIVVVPNASTTNLLLKIYNSADGVTNMTPTQWSADGFALFSCTYFV